MMNKKSVALPLQAIVIAILLLVVLGGVFYAIQKAYSPFAETLTSESLRNRQEKCRLEGIRNPSLLKDDNDDYPNSCDICPWYVSSEDIDNDNMPDGCDKDKFDATITECKYGYDKEKQHCYKLSKAEREKIQEAPAEEKPEKQQIAEEKLNEIDGLIDKSHEWMKKEEMDKTKESADKAFALLKDVIKNYSAPENYDRISNELGLLEGIYYTVSDYNNEGKTILNFYRETVEILDIKKLEFDLHTWQLKMLRNYKDIILFGELTGFTYNFDAAEQLLEQMEGDLKAPLRSDAKELAGEIFYRAGWKFLEKARYEKAAEYFKKAYTYDETLEEARQAEQEALAKTAA